MPSAYKILGQSKPANTSVATLYTVPAGTETVVSTLTATTITSTSSVIDIYVVPAAGSASDANAVVFGVSLAGSSVQAFSLGLTLGAGASLQVKTGTGNLVTFQAFGQEVS